MHVGHIYILFLSSVKDKTIINVRSSQLISFCHHTEHHRKYSLDYLHPNFQRKLDLLYLLFDQPSLFPQDTSWQIPFFFLISKR